jgi:hypothetical protein
LRSLAASVAQCANAGAEAKAIDTVLKRGAVAAKEALEERFELERAGDRLIDFDEFARGEFFPAWADGGVIAETVEKEFDFGEGEAHIAGETDQKDAMERVGGITTLAAEALGRGEKTAFFVIADGGGVQVGAASEFTDFHISLFLQTEIPRACRLNAAGQAAPSYRAPRRSPQEQVPYKEPAGESSMQRDRRAAILDAKRRLT